jgi:hypothetical protein
LTKYRTGQTLGEMETVIVGIGIAIAVWAGISMLAKMGE